MIMKIISTAALFLALFVTLSCKEDEETFAPIVGKWKGTLAEIEIQPFGIPLPVSKEDDTFDSEIEFRADGTIIVYDSSQPTEGTWELKGDKLTTDIDFNTSLIELSGTYTIEVLTKSTLVFYIEKENQTITDPDTGQSVSGDVKVSLHFDAI